MSIEILIPGIKFVEKYNLTNTELRILISFLERSHNVLDLSKKLGINQQTAYNVVQRLRLKNLLILKNKDQTGNNIYEFNKSQLEE